MKLPRYQKYKPSGLSACGHAQAGVPWLGDVPVHWEAKHGMRPKGASITQPRATPWVHATEKISALKGRDNGSRRGFHRHDDAALSGLGIFDPSYPGRCPGLSYYCPVGAQRGDRP